MKLFSNFIFNVVLTIISINIISSESNFSLIFPFKTIEKEEPELTTSYNVTITNEIMKNIFLNELFLKLEIGSPPQKINLRVSVNSNDFFVSKEDATFEKNYPKKQGNFYYNNSKSSTFEIQPNKKGNVYFSHIHESEYVMDNIKFHTTDKNKQINIKQFEFFLAHRVSGPNHGIVGLKISPHSKIKEDFLSSLKKYNLIKNKIWYLDFNNYNINGNLVIGNYPHFDNNIVKKDKTKYYDINHFEKIYSITYNEKWDSTWGLNFNKIFLQNITTSDYFEILNTNEKCKNAILNPNLGVIIGSHSFKYIFEVNYLNKYLNSGICYQPILRINRNYEQKSYYYYYCRSSYIEHMKKNFQPIIFEHKEFKFNFTLEFDDIYIKKNNYIFLRIIFDESNQNWLFGSPFFSKYTLFFDSDSKEIGFYSPNINNNIIKENYNKNKNPFTSKIFFQFFIGIFLLIVGIYLGKKIYGLKRKLRANELEDKFEYNPVEKQLQMY